MVPKVIGFTVGQRGELPQIAALTVVSRLLGLSAASGADSGR